MASPGDKVGIGPRLDPGISELFSNPDDPVDLQPLPRPRGDVWEYQPSHAKPIPSSRAGRHSLGEQAGVALGGSLVAFQQLCPSQSASGAELQEFPWSVGDGEWAQLLTSCCHSGIAI